MGIEQIQGSLKALMERLKAKYTQNRSYYSGHTQKVLLMRQVMLIFLSCLLFSKIEIIH